ncbi:MAG: 4Fe-4S binding protein [Deltaproteobacteria bacterium]|nr:4Fe-4S binding protein [Deltaproteobacteria bacterium]
MSARPPVIDSGRCSGCLACVKSCPNEALSASWRPEALDLWYDPGRCLFCGRCAEVCPEKAIEYAAQGLAPQSRVEKTLLAQLAAFNCAACGAWFTAVSGQERIEEKLNRPDRNFFGPRQTLCPRCRQEEAARARHGWRER